MIDNVLAMPDDPEMDPRRLRMLDEAQRLLLRRNAGNAAWELQVETLINELTSVLTGAANGQPDHG